MVPIGLPFLFVDGDLVFTTLEIEDWNDLTTPAQIDECKLMLIGKVPSAPSLNLQAFQSTIYLWGPWLFSRHLVIFKPWVPATPLHCYDFSTCAFWVHIYGLPLEWYSDAMISRAVQSVGKVLEVRLDAKEGTSLKSTKARVDIDLSQPLKQGKLIRVVDKLLWLDFRYERLPHFYYSCGKLGHYATYCLDIPDPAASKPTHHVCVSK
ncbi:hypothetical protein EUGRSUZ_F01116 [Eucalyptus grandis]|uniref:Zinc knuckle CX2CX4HX4C domain-containing protein n=2 Tax=Eucalyptus grandis TaxID=71139 RepID=A0A059BNQ0_EUCGR|nr:hypothetical protein EUGRSUZ_F01116 [Eucalyptus grandis]